MILLLCAQIALVPVCLACLRAYSFSADKELEKLDTMVAESYTMIERAKLWEEGN